MVYTNLPEHFGDIQSGNSELSGWFQDIAISENLKQNERLLETTSHLKVLIFDYHTTVLHQYSGEQGYVYFMIQFQLTKTILKL